MTLKQEDIRYMKETVRKAVDNSTKRIGPEKKKGKVSKKQES